MATKRTIRISPFVDSTSSFPLSGGSPIATMQPNASSLLSRLLPSQFQLPKNFGSLTDSLTSCKSNGMPSVASFYIVSKPRSFLGSTPVSTLPRRGIATSVDSDNSIPQYASASVSEVAPRLKFKRLDKTARNIMQIIDKEEVETVRTQREIPEIKPGYIIQLRLEVPENKRRVSLVKGIVIARRNAGLHTTIRLRRLVAGVGVESLLPLYSPNIKEIKVLDKKKVRRAKLYYLRDKMNALKKQ